MSIRTFAMNQGAFLGLILVAVALVEYIVGVIDIDKPILVWIINTLSLIHI